MSDLDKWILADNCEQITDEDIVETVLQQSIEASDNTEADDVTNGIGKLTSDEGFNALEVQ